MSAVHQNGPLVERTYLASLTFIEPLLGSQPTNNVALRWVRQRQTEALERELRRSGITAAEARAQAAERVAADVAEATPEGEDEEEPSLLNITGFLTDDRGLYLMDYMARGFLKAAARSTNLRVQGKTRDTGVSPLQDIGNLLWVFGTIQGAPRKLYLMRGEDHILAPDRAFDRPLRAQTARGERVSIAVSEVLDPDVPVSMSFELRALRGCRISEANLKELLAYGEYQGFGQWRSGGNGRFTFTLTDTTGT